MAVHVVVGGNAVGPMLRTEHCRTELDADSIGDGVVGNLHRRCPKSEGIAQMIPERVSLAQFCQRKTYAICEDLNVGNGLHCISECVICLPCDNESADVLAGSRQILFNPG